MSIYIRIREMIEAHPDDTNVQIAHRVFVSLGVKPPVAREELLPLVVDEVAAERRRMVRTIEQAAYSPRTDGLDPVQARKQLMGESFSTPDGRRVLWGQATVEDHRARADWLKVFAATVLTTAGRHEQAIAEIVAAGVTCLDEIEKRAA